MVIKRRKCYKNHIKFIGFLLIIILHSYITKMCLFLIFQRFSKWRKHIPLRKRIEFKVWQKDDIFKTPKYITQLFLWREMENVLRYVKICQLFPNSVWNFVTLSILKVWLFGEVTELKIINYFVKHDDPRFTIPKVVQMSIERPTVCLRLKWDGTLLHFTCTFYQMSSVLHLDLSIVAHFLR